MVVVGLSDVGEVQLRDLKSAGGQHLALDAVLWPHRGALLLEVLEQLLSQRVAGHAASRKACTYERVRCRVVSLVMSCRVSRAEENGPESGGVHLVRA